MTGRLAQPYLRTSWGRVRYREHFGRGALIYILGATPALDAEAAYDRGRLRSEE